MNESVLTEIDALAASGKAVIGGGDDGVVEVVKAAILADVSASFYLTWAQAQAIKDWYWTPEKIRTRGLEDVSEEESGRIKSELGLDLADFRFTPKECENGHRYGAFEFLQQGIKQHGLETVRAVFALKNATLFQVNPTFQPLCPIHQRPISKSDKSPISAGLTINLGGIEYDCSGYGGCCCCSRE